MGGEGRNGGAPVSFPLSPALVPAQPSRAKRGEEGGGERSAGIHNLWARLPGQEWNKGKEEEGEMQKKGKEINEEEGDVYFHFQSWQQGERRRRTKGTFKRTREELILREKEEGG